MSPGCDRCTDYAYDPVRIGSVVGDWHEYGDTVVLPEGFDGCNILCRDCARALDLFLNGGEVDDDPE